MSVGAMRAERIQQSNLLPWNVAKGLEQPRYQPVVGRCACDVSKANANSISGLDQIAQGWTGYGIFERGENGGAFVGETGRVRGLDNGRALVGQLNREMTLTVGEINFHQNDTD